MSYHWVDHTAELQLEIEADAETGIFGEALRACAELLADDAGGEEVVRRLELIAPDRAALLVAFVDELVYVAETQDLVPARVVTLELGQGRLAGEIAFTRARPRHLIKGATYHRLVFERAPSGYRATVIIDV